uniref:COesterase domain-containing protein n=1 Tax=Steinernema glaseri TaxID=37863 RepID=A0A1I7ZMD3_9BILA
MSFPFDCPLLEWSHKCTDHTNANVTLFALAEPIIGKMIFVGPVDHRLPPSSDSNWDGGLEVVTVERTSYN